MIRLKSLNFEKKKKSCNRPMKSLNYDIKTLLSNSRSIQTNFQSLRYKVEIMREVIRMTKSLNYETELNYIKFNYIILSHNVKIKKLNF